MNLELAPSFVKAYKHLIKRDSKKAEVVKEKIEQFRLNPKHPLLRAHKLSGFATETATIPFFLLISALTIKCINLVSFSLSAPGRQAYANGLP